MKPNSPFITLHGQDDMAVKIVPDEINSIGVDEYYKIVDAGEKLYRKTFGAKIVTRDDGYYVTETVIEVDKLIRNFNKAN